MTLITAASDRTFGIEIETGIPRNATGIGNNGRQIDQAPYNWKGKSDCSIDVRNHAGVEIVSPILTGEDGLIQVWYMSEYLQKIPARSNASCGIHVHVGARDLTSGMIDTITETFKVYERAFFALNGDQAYDRWHSTYCKPSTSWMYSRADYDRYQSLNLTNMGDYGKGTIEFRLFASIIDPMFTVTAVSMAVALVQACANGYVAEVPTCSTANLARHYIRNVMRKANNRIIPQVDCTDTSKMLFSQVNKASV